MPSTAKMEASSKERIIWPGVIVVFALVLSFATMAEFAGYDDVQWGWYWVLIPLAYLLPAMSFALPVCLARFHTWTIRGGAIGILPSLIFLYIMLKTPFAPAFLLYPYLHWLLAVGCMLLGMAIGRRLFTVIQDGWGP